MRFHEYVPKPHLQIYAQSTCSPEMPFFLLLFISFNNASNVAGTGDNPPAKARGLSTQTGDQTMVITIAYFTKDDVTAGADSGLLERGFMWGSLC